MQLNDFSNFAVLGTAVTGLALDHVNTSGVNGSNTNINEAVMHFDNLTGAASITNSTIQGGISDNFSLINNGANVLNLITFNTVTFGPMDSGNTNGDDSLFIQARNTATVNVTIQSSTFTSARGDIFQLDLTDTAHGDLVFKSNTVNNTHPFVVVGGGGITLSGGGSVGAAPTLTYDIGGLTAAEGNTFRGARGDALLIVFQTGNGSATGKIRNNVFGVAATDLSGAREASDIEIRTVGRAAQTVLIDSNQAYQYGNNGIYIQMGDMSVVGTGGTVGALNATISNNTVSNFSTNPATKSGIHVNLGTTTGDTYQACVDMFNNNAPNSGSTDTSAGSDLILRQRQSTTMRLPNYSGATTDTAAVTAYIKGRNTNGASSSVFVATPSGGGGYTGGAGSCGQPPLLYAPGGVEAAVVPCSLLQETSAVSPASGPFAGHPRVEVPKLALPRAGLLQADLDVVTAIAQQRWQATGLTPEQVARLHALQFEVAKLPGLRVAEADGDRVRIDSNAGGHGWFVGSDAFIETGTRSYTDSSTAAAGRMDLLTAIMHEMGHALGLDDTYAEQDRDNLMYGFLTKGERRLPVKGQATGATPGSLNNSAHFLSSPLTVGTLPAGKSVVITYQVTITGAATSISNQGSVTGGNVAGVFTDDPQTGTASDATVTPVELPPSVSNVSASTNEDTTLIFTSVIFTGGYNDANGDALATVSITSGPSNGVLKNSGTTITTFPANFAIANIGNLTYVPNANYNGSDSFNWNASDGTLFASSSAAVNLTVNPVNDAPTLNAISNPVAIPEDSPQQTVNLAGISAGPSNESSQTITITATSGNTAVIPNPTVTYTSPSTTGSLAYTPVANANGSAVITVTVTDNGGTANGGLDSVQRTFTVNVTPVNDAPSITGQLPVATAFNTARTITFSDLQVTDVDNTYPTGFTLTVSPGTNYSLSGNTVTPANNFFGTLAVPVKVNDGALDSNTYQLAMTVNPDPNRAKSATSIAKDPAGYKISFIGNPGAQYTVQYTNALPPLPAVPAWQTLEVKIAQPDGTFSSIDNPGPTTRFYRAIIP